MIYLIAGKARTGKDTVADIIAKECHKKNLRHLNLQFSYYLKKYAMNIMGWDGNEATKPREFLQYLGTDLIRKKTDEDFFVRRVEEDLKIYLQFFQIITISDVRFINEIEQLKNNFPNVITINLIRNLENPNESDQHISETELDNYQTFDYTIDNNETISELEKKVIMITNKTLK